MFSDYWVQIDPEEYLLDVSENHDGSICHIEVLPNTYGFFLLGQPIFQGYYTHHDMDAQTIGFIPHSMSTKPFLQIAELPT